MTDTHERAQHSPIGASSSERWWHCPGSVKLAESLPPSPDTIYTTQGTVAHQLGEGVIRAYQTLEEAGFTHEALCNDTTEKTLQDEIGKSYVESGFEIEVTEDMADAVQVYIDLIDQYVRDYALRWQEHIRAEIQFDLTHIDPEAYGTCDCRILIPGYKLVVADYKHGAGHAVEVTDNHQLRYYALGAYYDLSEDARRTIHEIDIIIVQPRARHLHGPIRSQTLSVGELRTFEVDLSAAIRRVRGGDPTLQTGPWCKFCPAKPICPAVRQELEHETQIAFGPIDVQPVQLPDPRGMDADKLGQLARNANVIIDWARSIIGLATNTADKGLPVTGFKLVTKYGNRRWKDEREVERAFKLEFGDQLFNRKLKSPAQLEKVLGKKRKDEIAPYYEIPETGKTLVAEGDAREGVASGVADAFADDFLKV